MAGRLRQRGYMRFIVAAAPPTVVNMGASGLDRPLVGTPAFVGTRGSTPRRLHHIHIRLNAWSANDA